MDLAAVFLLSLIGGYFFAYWWRLTAYSTRRADGQHLYFRAALCGVILFAIALSMRRLLLPIAGYSRFDAFLLQYVAPVLKDDAGSTHPLEQAHRAEWVVTALYSLVLAPIAAIVCNLVTPKRWAAHRSLGQLDNLLLRAQEQEEAVLVTLNTGKVYIGLVVSITDPDFNPPTITLLPMLSGFRDSKERMTLTTDYEAAYGSLATQNSAAANLTQFNLVIRADTIVSASQFSLSVYAKCHPDWRANIQQENRPPEPLEMLVHMKRP